MDLNVIAKNYIAESDVQALARCVEYSLQPEKVLQYIFDSKRYECLPPLLPLLQLLFLKDKRHELGINILLDLLSMGEVPSAPVSLDLDFFLEAAVQRKVVVKFKNIIFNPKRYYKLILKEDCVELFVILREKILNAVDNLYDILVKHASAQIFETLQISVMCCGICFHPLLHKYTIFSLNALPEAGKYERMLRHILNDAALEKCLDRLTYRLEEINGAEELRALLNLGYQMSVERKEAILACNQKLYTCLFGEDV